nr:hypothetical protein HK105_001797 [Polyrhizophydium stewartii]
MPHPSTFPFAKLQITLQDGSVIDLSEDLVKQSLQYSSTAGLDGLVSWVRNFQVLEHGRAADSFDICMGNGSQDVLSKAFDAVLSPGDTILIESPAYVGVLAYLRPMGLNLAEVPVDAEGLSPDALDTMLAAWPAGKPMPRVLYTVPIAGNPTGVTTTVERKQRIYQIARKYNILILEDDPYYFLQFGEKRDPSYFSMDVDGRVLRFDSISKILSGGARIGWVTGPKQLVDRIILHSMSTILHPSGLSQALVLAVLEKWGVDGLQKHAREVAAFYKDKRDAFVASARRHLDGVAEFTVPTAGMFVWLKLIGIEDSFELISTKAVDKKVVLVPGTEFLPNQRPTPYVRASYSIASKEDIDTALERLRALVLEARK